MVANSVLKLFSLKIFVVLTFKLMYFQNKQGIIELGQFFQNFVGQMAA